MDKENYERGTNLLPKSDDLIDETEFEIYVNEKRRHELIRKLSVQLKRIREAKKETETLFTKE